jgi:exosortase A
MAHVWRSTQYYHGMLIFPVAGYFLWSRRERLARAELAPSPLAIVPVLGLVLIWFVAASVGVQFVQHLAAVLLIPATVLAFLGPRLVRAALFPLLFLVAAVPVGDGLVPRLMQVTASLSTALLRAVGVPVFRQGQLLNLPGGDFEIADVCAGLQFLIAGTIIGLLFAQLTYRSNVRRTVFVVAMAAVMVVANGLRAFTVMYVASATRMRWFTGQDHVYFGWLLFGVVVFAMLVAGGRFADRDRDDEPLDEPELAPTTYALPLVLVLGLVLAAAGAAALRTRGLAGVLLWPALGAVPWLLSRRLAPTPTPSRTPNGGAYARPSTALALCGCALVLGSAPWWMEKQILAAPSAPVIVLPSVAGCEAPAAWSAAWRPNFVEPDAEVAGTYRCDGAPVDAFVAVYVRNVEGHELVSESNRPLPDKWWRLAASEERSFAAADGGPLRVNEVQFDESGSRRLAWYWYAIGGEAVTTGTAVKLRQALQVLAKGRSDGAALVVETPLDGGIEASRERLARVAREVAAIADAGAAGAAR